MNRLELEALGERRGLVCLTLGAEGAVLLEDGEEVARAEPPPVEAVDGTGAGDAFTACLVVSLLEGRDARGVAAPRVRRRSARRVALRRPDLAPDRGGGGRAPVTHRRSSSTATPATTTRSRSCSRSPRRRSSCVGVTTVAGNQTLDKTTRNALVTLEIAGRSDIPVAAGAEAPLRRELRTAAHVHGETGLDGPELPEPSARPVDAHAADFLAELIEPGVVLVPTAPLTNVALMLERHPDVPDRLERIVWMGGAIAEGNVTPAAEFNAFVDPEAAASGVRERDPDHDGRARRDAQGAVHARARRAAARKPAARAASSPSCRTSSRRFHERSYGFDGSPIHDAMAVAHVIDPTLDDDAPLRTSRSRRGRSYCDGRTVVDLRGVTGREPNADVGVDVDAERFLELLVSRIASLP